MPLTYAQVKARKESDPEYAARLKSYADKYKEKNLDKEKERQRIVKAKVREKDREAYNAYMREYNKENVYPKKSEAVLKKKKEHPEYVERVSTKSQLTQAEYWRHWKMKKTHGIGMFEYRKMYEDQNGKCAICDDFKASSGRDGLVIDHCHKQGHIRKLLCAQCNIGLGHFRDDVLRLTNAIEYLKRF